MKLRPILLALICVGFISQQTQADGVSPVGMDQVLSSFASIVKDRGNEVALDIVRQELVSDLSGKTVTLQEDNKNPSNSVVVYMGYVPPKPVTEPSITSTPDPRVFFENSFRLLDPDKANLSITDPILLKTVSQDLVEFSLRASLNSMSVTEFENLNMRGVAKFIYQTIETMAGPNPDVHDLADPLIDISNSIFNSFNRDFSNEVGTLKGKRTNSSPISTSLTDGAIRTAVGKQVDKMVDKKPLAEEYEGIDSKFIPKSYVIANVDARYEVSSLFLVIGSVLQSDQVDHDATSQWLKKFSGMAIAKLGTSSDAKIIISIRSVLKDNALKGKSDFVNSTMKTAFESFFDALVMKTYVSKKGKDILNPALVSDVLKITNSLIRLASEKNTTPEEIGLTISNVLDSFSVIIEKSTNKDGDIPESALILEQVSTILKSVSKRDWVALVQLLYDNPSIINKNGLDGHVLSFLRILMQAYEAKSVDDAKQILSAGLEDLSSRRKRYKNPLTVDVTCLLGVRGGYEDSNEYFPLHQHPNLLGLYAPLGVQFGFTLGGLMIYPVDLGTYLIASDKPANEKINDAVRVGAALYFRAETVPLDFGLGADFKPSFDGTSEVYRGFVFTSLELPLFMLQ